MKPLLVDYVDVMRKQRTGGQSQFRTMILVVVCFVAGLALSAAWFSHRVPAPAPDAAAPAGPVLSSATKAVLNHLASPVEIRFYSLLDPASVSDDVQAFAGRVDQLLAQYQQEAGGKIKLTRIAYQSYAYSNANAALADGLKPFNSEKGDACYLGIALVRDNQKESLSTLAPEWEQALEPDLTRALARLAEANPKAPLTAPSESADLEAVKRSIPNLDSVTLEQGMQTLRQSAFMEFMRTAQEMEAEVKAAEQRFSLAQNNQSEAEQQAALQELQKLKAARRDKLDEIAARSSAQIGAFQQLKGAR